MIWVSEIDSAKSIEEQRTPESILGHPLPNFEQLDMKIANALKKILAAYDFRKKVFIEEQKAQKRKSISSRKTDRSHDVR